MNVMPTNNHRFGYKQVCGSSPWCEDDVCRCNDWDEEESKKDHLLNPLNVGIYGIINNDPNKEVGIQK